jgi:uncharacterized protein (DUF2062 family)
VSRFNAWIRAQAPSRESFERSRFLRPFAQRVFHPALWRFTRRSVPRGVALGLLVGYFSHPVLVLAAAGLALTMLIGILTRIRIGDSLAKTLPAIVLLVLNAFVLGVAITRT